MRSTCLSRRSVVGGLASLLPLVSPLPGPLRPGSALAAGEDGDVRIAFVGDSLSDGMWGGMARLVSHEACLRTRVKLGRFAQNGSGLTRPAKFDWIAESRNVATAFKPTLTVVSLGLNDRQSIVDASRARFDLGTPAWRTRYGELTQAVARNLVERSAAVLWLGIPALRDAVSQEDAAAKNAIFAEAIKGVNDPKVRFAGPWQQEAAGPDAFRPYGPDLKGAQVQIRAPDGIHFTAAGYDVLAAYLMRNAAACLKDQGVSLGYPCRA